MKATTKLPPLVTRAFWAAASSSRSAVRPGNISGLHFADFRIGIGGLLISLLSVSEVAAAQSPSAASQVDLELVVTVDVSLPMDRDEQVVARNGYIDAFRSPEFIDAIMHGPKGRIAVTYVEFSDVQTVVVTMDPDRWGFERECFCRTAEPGSGAFLRTTSISGDLLFSANLFDSSGFVSPRRTIDVSGNGPNNDGIAVVRARDALAAKGISINGLPIDLGPVRR